MRRALPLVLVALALAPGTRAIAAPQPVELAAGATVDGLRLADLDRDGVRDLLLLEGRTVRVWRGRRGALPGAPPDRTFVLPPDVSFVDVARGGDPGLLVLGTDGLRLLPDARAGEAPPPRPLDAQALSWRDADRAVFAPLATAEGLLALDPAGVALRPWGGGPRLELHLHTWRDVGAPGPFLEDTASVVEARPTVLAGRCAHDGDEGPALWALDGPSLLASAPGAVVRYDLSFLSAGTQEDFDQTLVDLDGDGRPDLLHRIHSNREARYGFFRTRPAAPDSTSGPSHKPVVSSLFLSGFQLDPDLLDLDGDRLRDLVVTSMQINAANMLGALMSGKVTAETRAFLNRWKRGSGSFFDSEPDALVKSQIDVKVRFNEGGNIEVVRSFLILLDGDYDGDGRRDLAIRTGPRTLTIRPGRETGVWAADDGAREVALPEPGGSPDVEGYAGDLDGDGRDEIVLVYRKAPGGEDRVRILDPQP